jgi:hypothetical protein
VIFNNIDTTSAINEQVAILIGTICTKEAGEAGELGAVKCFNILLKG